MFDGMDLLVNAGTLVADAKKKQNFAAFVIEI
jgi:hypothetical protein